MIHCAAFTGVDRAEAEKELCFDINVRGTRFIAEACHELKIKMLYISTDYIFDGTGDTPWKVEDQVSSPTDTHDLANLLCQMIQTEKYGIYHATNEGTCSWYEFACEIFKQAGGYSGFPGEKVITKKPHKS